MCQENNNYSLYHFNIEDIPLTKTFVILLIIKSSLLIKQMASFIIFFEAYLWSVLLLSLSIFSDLLWWAESKVMKPKNWLMS
ncbi:hypothetical protein CRI66_17150 [Escherichia sp. E4694]|nr:hypothetical protein CRI66_17150 [Escherichia sp. E4694]